MGLFVLGQGSRGNNIIIGDLDSFVYNLIVKGVPGI